MKRSMNIKIRTTDSIENLLQSINVNYDNLNIFFTPNYAEYITDSTAKYLYLYSENYIIPIVIHKRYLFIYASLPVEPYLYSTIGDYSEKEFLNQCVLTAKKKLHIQWFTPTFASAFFSAYPRKSNRIPFGSHVLDLTKSEEELFSALHSKHRNVIKKAQNDGVLTKMDGDSLINDYVVLDAQTWARSKMNGQSEQYFLHILKSLKQNVLVSIAYKNEEPQSGAIFFFNRCMSYYMYGASKNSPYTGAANLLHWEAIKYMKSIGVQKYSFVGCRINEDSDSKYHTIQRFKERFGGELISGYMFKIVLNKVMFSIYKILLFIKHRQKIDKDAVDQEIYKWRDLQID